MGLIICFVCGRQREIKPIKKGGKYTCSNCGAKKVQLIRSRLYASYTAWVDKEGIDAERARHDLYGELIGYAQRREYEKAKGWAAHKFHEITGRWPNGEAVELPAPASGRLLKWIKQQNIAYSKRKRAEESATGTGKEAIRLAGMGDWISVREPDNVDNTSPLMTGDDWDIKL